MKTKVEIVEWFSDFGSTKLTATLTFEAGHLIRIDRGGHGGD